MNSRRFRSLALGLVIGAVVMAAYGSSVAAPRADRHSRLPASVTLPLTLPEGIEAVIEITYANSSGTPFCDGISLTIDPAILSVVGTQTGCKSGPAYGAVNFSLAPQGVGAGVAFSGDYLGFYTQLTFNPPVWIIYNSSGTIQNSGLILYQPAEERASKSRVPAVELDWTE